MKMQNARAKRKKTVNVLAQGTFDWVHPGHLHYLSFARKQGTRLTVIVARDVNVKRFKGHFPVCDENARLKVVFSLKMVDDAVLGGEGNIFDKVCELKPDVLVLGHDQKADEKDIAEELKRKGVVCKIVRAPPFRPTTFKSSILMKRVH